MKHFTLRYLLGEVALIAALLGIVRILAEVEHTSRVLPYVVLIAVGFVLCGAILGGLGGQMRNGAFVGLAAFALILFWVFLQW